MIKVCAWIVAATTFGVTAAHASPYLIHLQRQRGETLIIEHTPVPARAKVRKAYRGKAIVVKRRVRRVKALRRVRRVYAGYINVAEERIFWTGAIAGGCRNGGFVHRPIAGRIVTLQREVCRSIAPGLRMPRPKLPGVW
jgi:hypothetical protein